METSKSNYPDYTSEGKFKVIGTRPVRHDGVDKVTGRAVYGGDVRLPGLLYGKVLRSPHPHARILSIDTSMAMQLPGVRAVVTAHAVNRDGEGHGPPQKLVFASGRGASRHETPS